MNAKRLSFGLIALIAVACSDGASPNGSGSGGASAVGAGGSESHLGAGGGVMTSGGAPGVGGATVGDGSGGAPDHTGGSFGSGGRAAASGGSTMGAGGQPSGPGWLPSWACSIQGYESTKADHQPPIALPNNTLRQFVYPTYDGTEVRIQLSNEKGEAPLDLAQVHIALPTSNSGIDPNSDTAFTFSGSPSVTIPAGETVWSDGVNFELKRAQKVALSVQFGAQVPQELTTHPGSRSTSFFANGDAVAQEMLGDQSRDRWYFINALAVMAPEEASAIAILGDSITDGYGILNSYERWPDIFTLAVGNDAMLKDKVSVLNFGMGANELTNSTEDQDAGQLRFVRDVLPREKVKWLIILEGVNDINNDVEAQPIIDAYQEIITQAHAKGIEVFISPITPMGSDNTVRNTVNDWIRANAGDGGLFEGVIDFDEAVRDPNNVHSILPAYQRNDGDMLHPAAPGYAAMGNAVELSLFY